MPPRKEMRVNLLVTDGMKWNWGRLEVERPLDKNGRDRFRLTAVGRGRKEGREKKDQDGGNRAGCNGSQT